MRAISGSLAPGIPSATLASPLIIDMHLHAHTLADYSGGDRADES